MSVEWSALAEQDWKRLSLADAEAVARAIRHFHDTGEGTVIATGPTRVSLARRSHAVVLLVDGDMMHVDRVRVA